MCGIAGIIDPHAPSDVTDATVRRMAAAIAHRGPDEDGFFLDASAGVALGHRRLSVVDLSPAGAQPMASRSGRWVVIYNGELYNQYEVRRELGASVPSWRGHSDTETLVEAIDEWGIDGALARLEGMFAIAAYDTVQRRLVIARDRLGEKPLYWAWHDGRFVFASELAALRAVPGLDLEIDAAAVASVLRWSFVPHPHTIYRGVHQLPPGHLLVVDTGATACPTPACWWSLGETVATAPKAREGLTLDAAANELEQLLAASVAARLESDVPLGAFLSGGIDSSLVAALAQRAMGGQRLRTFTVSMPDAGLDEAEHAAVVARHLGTDHDTLNLGLRDALDTITTLPTMWDEPFADPSMLPSALLCRAAREHVTVCLGGDGGDEVFAGYNRHAAGVRVDAFGRRLPAWLSAGIARAALRAPSRWLDRVGRQRVFGALPNLGDKVQKAALLMGSDAALWEQLAGIWPADALPVAAHQPMLPTQAAAMGRVEQLMLADTAAVLPDQMLVKVDRASMAASLEVRSPFLAPSLLEWSWGLPLELKTHRGVGKIVVRRLAHDLLPAAIADRKKLGFDPPLAGWLRNELRPWAESLLAAPRCVDEGWLDGDRLRVTWAEHLAGTRNWDYRLWAVLMLEAWMQEHHPR